MRAKLGAIPLLLLAGIGLAACSGGGRHRARLTDGDAGAERTRHRVVCLTPSATEIVAALGATDEIVGVDKYSVYPAEVAHLPRVGDFLSPNVEAILALTPDIAVLDHVQATLVPKLEAAEITAISVKMEKVSDVPAALLRVGNTLGRSPEAKAAIARFEADLAAIAAAPRGPSRPRVLIIVDRQPGGLSGIYAAGPGTFLDELVALAGGDNALAESPVAYSSLAAEHVVALAPEVILELGPAATDARARADWAALSSVPAVKAGRVHALAEPALLSPGPRTPAAAMKLVPLLHPGS